MAYCRQFIQAEEILSLVLSEDDADEWRFCLSCAVHNRSDHFTSITFNFPTISPVDSENMNYTSAAVGIIMLVAVVTWLVTGRKNFRGPESGGVVLEGEHVGVIEDGVVHGVGGKGEKF